MIIAQISDTHIMAKAAADPEGAARAETLRRCVADINRQGVDAVVHTGDSVHHGTADDYEHLREILQDLEAPLFLVPGNRDRHDLLRDAFDHPSYFSEKGRHLHYAVEDYPIRLVALDSVDAGERKGVFCRERLAWLDETLAREPEWPTILFMHHPPFDIPPHYVGGYRVQQQADDLEQVVSRYPQVVRVLCGHVHCLSGVPWGGTIATTMPSVAVDLRQEGGEAIRSATLYLLHVASADGGLDSRARLVGD